jgi:ubiquitin carboxyl-terminal hydrolase 48
MADSSRKRKHEEQDAGLALLAGPDPYGLARSHVCEAGSHRKPYKRNHKGNLRCLFGLGEGREGVWSKKPPMLPAVAEENARDLDQPAPVGLRNLGNTCYLNAQLQCLYALESFRRAIYSYPEPPFSSQSSQVLLALQALFASMEGGKQSVCDPSPLLQLLQLDTSEQQDPSEFNSLFMHLLQKCLRETDNAELAAHISRLFRIDFEVVTTCQSCGRTSSRSDAAMELRLNLMHGGSVRECVASALGSEELTGENRYFCENCGLKQDALREQVVAGCPPVLTLQVVRYKYEKQCKQKIRRGIAVDPALEMTLKGGGTCTYELVGALSHKGAGAASGHYVARLKCSRGGYSQWYILDDESVMPVKEENAQGKGKGKSKRKGSEDDPDEEANEQDSSSGSTSVKGRNEDVYMLCYVLKNGDRGDHAASSFDAGIPPHARSAVVAMNASWEATRAAEAREQSEIASLIERRKRTYSACFGSPLAADELVSCAPSDDELKRGKFMLVEMQWLQQWVTGLTSGKDTPSGMVVFCEPMHHDQYRCQHGALHPDNLKLFKMVTDAAYAVMTEECGAADFDFSGETYYCEDCIAASWEQAKERENTEKKHERIKQALDEPQPEPSEGPVNVISRQWEKSFRAYYTKTIKQSGQSGRKDSMLLLAMPTESDVNEDLICAHGGLRPDPKLWRPLSDSAWGCIEAAFTARKLSPISDCCKVCAREAESEVDARRKKSLAVAEELSSPQLKLLLQRPLDYPPRMTVPLYAVDAKWMASWRDWLKDRKFILDRPCPLSNNITRCDTHGKAVLPKNVLELVVKGERLRGAGKLETDVELVTEDEWLELMGGAASRPCDDHHAPLQTVWLGRHWEPPLCEECAEADRRQFENKSLNIVLLGLGQIPPAADSAGDFLSSTFRRTTRQKAGKAGKVLVSSKDRVMMLKLKIYELMSVAPVAQELSHMGKVLAGCDEETLASLDIKAGDTIFVKSNPQADAMDEEYEAYALSVAYDGAGAGLLRTPESGFKGSLLGTGAPSDDD